MMAQRVAATTENVRDREGTPAGPRSTDGAPSDAACGRFRPLRLIAAAAAASDMRGTRNRRVIATAGYPGQGARADACACA